MINAVGDIVDGVVAEVKLFGKNSNHKLQGFSRPFHPPSIYRASCEFNI